MNFFLFVSALLLTACQHGLKSHPIEDKAQQLVRNLKGVDVVLLGEKHDNPWHHKYQAEVIKNLAQKGILDNVYMEHLFQSQERVLSSFPKDSWSTELNWENSGWPSYEQFSPVFNVINEFHISVKGVGISRPLIKRLYKGRDPKLISQDMKDMLGLRDSLPPKANTTLLNKIISSHCGYVDEKHAEKMIPLQRYRDAYMASRLEVQSGKIAVFLVGAGHARKDFGVPYYLSHSTPNLKVKSVYLSEGEDDKFDQQVFDHVVVLPTTKREDPCEKYKKSLKKFRK